MVENTADTGDGVAGRPVWSTISEATDVFSAARPRLFGIAYRMLGSVSEAEDIVQESWLRWQATDRSVVENPNAFLATITTRLAMNLAQSARARHETYIGPWLPDPVDTSANPALGAERGEALEYAVLILLEKLTPAERAAYVLREAFDYPYELIADVVQATEPATRKLVSRARKHLADERRRPAPAAEHKRLLSAFLTAAQSGDVAVLEKLFADDVVSYSDGGGVKLAARIPIIGRSRVAKFVAAFSSHFWTGVDLRWVEANGRPSVELSRDGVPFTIVTATTSADGIDQLLWLMNPAKLRPMTSAS
ncbi:RNA polymerase sigma-70 factor [Subtercola endophyticus]|uniref:RNA polymerase sigma-70 factor n=1 Tax=Subtercola endophyticus TaxID=2895559 RepID=UPI001E5DEF55|nr:RNA polymerase sigma-70 factor [Subtercola endophyticus]UFS59436.1 RNA polymerase sigma-70 factor [Subtercola endophyticus]